MALLEVTLLGPPTVRRDGKRLAGWKSDKVLALLAYLVMEDDRPHYRDTLAGLLWPNFPEKNAHSNLRSTLHNLRRILGDGQKTTPFLQVNRETIRFNQLGDSWLDVRAFKQFMATGMANWPDPEPWRRAVDLHWGPFLEGFSVDGCLAFEEWVLVQRERLERRLVIALQKLAACYQEQGHYAEAEDALRRTLKLEPLDERGHRRLMGLLVLDGRRAQALAHYELCRQLLAEELGVAPASETIRLYERILEGRQLSDRLKANLGLARPVMRDKGDPQPAVNEMPAELVRLKVVRNPNPPPSYVSFEAELARLNRHLEDASSGRGQVVFISGEAGCGKSRLFGEFARRALSARGDLLVAAGRCDAQLGLGDLYQPFRDTLQMLAGQPEVDYAWPVSNQALAQRLQAAHPEVRQLLAEQGLDLPGNLLSNGQGMPQPSTGPGQPDSNQAALFERLAQFYRALSRRRPLILALDDLQWADPGSISLLFYLGRRLAGSRILVVGLYRPEALTWSGSPGQTRERERHPLLPVIHELCRYYGDVCMDLNQANGKSFVDAFLDSEPNHLDGAFRSALFRRSGGNPLFSIELVRALQDRGRLVKDRHGFWVARTVLDWDLLPVRVEAIIAERLGRLPSVARAILTAASVQGQTFVAEVAAQVCAISPDQAMQMLGGMLSRRHRLVQVCTVEQLGEERLTRYQFRHDLFRHYLYQRLDQGRRAILHERTGRAFERLYQGQAGDHALELARHFELAGIADKAGYYLLLGGEKT